MAERFLCNERSFCWLFRSLVADAKEWQILQYCSHDQIHAYCALTCVLVVSRLFKETSEGYCWLSKAILFVCFTSLWNLRVEEEKQRKQKRIKEAWKNWRVNNIRKETTTTGAVGTAQNSCNTESGTTCKPQACWERCNYIYFQESSHSRLGGWDQALRCTQSSSTKACFAPGAPSNTPLRNTAPAEPVPWCLVCLSHGQMDTSHIAKTPCTETKQLLYPGERASEVTA